MSSIIIDTQDSKLHNVLGITRVEYKLQNFSDASISNFILSNGKIFTEDVDNIFINLSIGKLKSKLNGLRLAQHIRLSKEFGNFKFCQIVLISNLNLEEIIKIDWPSKNSQILLTPSTYLAKFEKSSIEFFKENVNVLNEETYYSQYLNQIEIPKPPKTGNHSIANEWGMYRLDEIAGTQVLNKEKNSKFKYLFFKWLNIKYPSKELRSQEIKEVKKEYKATLPGLKIIDKIDLSKRK